MKAEIVEGIIAELSDSDRYEGMEDSAEILRQCLLDSSGPKSLARLVGALAHNERTRVSLLNDIVKAHKRLVTDPKIIAISTVIESIQSLGWELSQKERESLGYTLQKAEFRGV